jgi:ABC-2 type transport system ATP-binding protein
VVAANAAVAAPAVHAALAAAGILVEHVEQILPSLEDVFVSLIEAEDRAEARQSLREH